MDAQLVIRDGKYLHQQKLSWHDVMYGIRNGLISRQAVVDFGIEVFREEEDYSDALLELVSLEKGWEVTHLVEELVEIEGDGFSEELIKKKWLYLVLVWLFEHQGEYGDPLDMIEAIYADFDYPGEIAHLVRYMPIKSDPHGNFYTGRNRILDDWEKFVQEKKEEYLKSTPCSNVITFRSSGKKK